MDVNWFKMIYTVLGGLGLFFYGMKLLSEGLQNSASRWIRQAINKVTSNRLIAVLVGVGVTCLVQSSSITTVMIVGLVNAGLMDLYQAIGVILGANIGTTITGWLISIKISKYSLLFIGVGILPLLFSKNQKIAAAARVLFSIGLIFLGLSTMSGAFKPLRGHEDFLSLMSYFSATDYYTLWAAVIVGCILTFLIQSSSAMLGITIALALSGSITYQTALALVLGENIGTTITAYLAGIGGNTAARRAAIAHGLFNICGVLVITSFFWSYKDLIDSLISGDPDFIAADGSKPHIAAHIAAGHTIFNVANVIIFLPFIGALEKITRKIIPDPEHKEAKTLTFLGDRSTLSPTIAIESAEQELKKLSVMVLESLLDTKKYFTSSLEDQPKLRKKIEKFERISDNITDEVMLFFNNVLQKHLNVSSSQQIVSLIRISNELESISDYSVLIIQHIDKARKTNTKLSDETKQELVQLFEQAQEMYNCVNGVLIDDQQVSTEYMDQLQKVFHKKYDHIQEQWVHRLNQNTITPQAALYCNHIATSTRKIQSHSKNIIEAYQRSED